MRPWYENVVEAVDEDAYYKCFDAATHPDPNERPGDDPDDPLFERWYEPMEQRVLSAVSAAGVPTNAAELFYPWVPNRTRHVTVELAHVTPAVVAALHALLLDDDYRGWRLELMIDETMVDHRRVGNIGLWRDWALCWGVGRSVLPTRSAG